MEPSTADAVKRVLTTAGVTGAALTLAAGAALPAYACDHGDSGDHAKSPSQTHNQSKDQGSRDQSKGSSDDKATKGSGDQSKGTSDDKAKGSDDGHNPPGNNGTVKIHQTAGDSSPHNVPHVDCSFYVSFFGFDANQTLNISFTGQAPTGKDVPVTIKDSSKTSKTSTTDAGGAGNDYDGDQGAYDGTNLDLSGLGAPAKQGYHIKLDVATGEPGGHKYKVFWFMPCTSGSTTPTTAPTTGATESGGTTHSGDTKTPESTTQGATTQGATTQGTTTEAATTTGSTAGGASVLGETLSRGTTSTAGSAGSVSSGAKVLGEKLTRSTPGLAALPFTGSEAGVLAALGVAALGGGAALTVAGRRRRAASRA